MLAIAVDGYNVPLWMASASLSGISMLNSCRESVSCYYSSPSHRKNAYLLNGHHDLNNIEAVQAQVVCEVGSSVNLSIPCQTIRISSKHLALNYLSSERKTNLAGIGNLFAPKILVFLLYPSRKSCTHLIKVLQQVHYTALNLLLGETSGSRVETRSLSVEDRNELRWANSRSDLNARSSSPDGARNGSSQRAHDSGAEHFEELKQSAC